MITTSQQVDLPIPLNGEQIVQIAQRIAGDRYRNEGTDDRIRIVISDPSSHVRVRIVPRFGQEHFVTWRTYHYLSVEGDLQWNRSVEEPMSANTTTQVMNVVEEVTKLFVDALPTV